MAKKIKINHPGHQSQQTIQGMSEGEFQQMLHDMETFFNARHPGMKFSIEKVEREEILRLRDKVPEFRPAPNTHTATVHDEGHSKKDAWSNFVKFAKIAPSSINFGKQRNYRINADNVENLKRYQLDGLSTTKMINCILRSFFLTHGTDLEKYDSLFDFYEDECA